MVGRTINGKAALKWVLQDENVTTSVPGITSLEQLEADLSIMADPVLTAEEKADLRLTEGESAAEGLFCAGCGACRVRCAAGFDVRARVLDIARLKAVPEEFLRP
jgi:hypothetical protein